MARNADHCACALGAATALLLLVERVLRLSLDLEEGEGAGEGAELADAAMQMLTDLIFAMLPLMFACAVGTFCCRKDSQ